MSWLRRHKAEPILIAESQHAGACGANRKHRQRRPCWRGRQLRGWRWVRVTAGALALPKTSSLIYLQHSASSSNQRILSHRRSRCVHLHQCHQLTCQTQSLADDLQARRQGQWRNTSMAKRSPRTGGACKLENYMYSQSRCLAAVVRKRPRGLALKGMEWCEGDGRWVERPQGQAAPVTDLTV